MTVIPMTKDQCHKQWHSRIGMVRLKGRENIAHIGVATSLDVDPSRVLAAALEANLQTVVVIGYDPSGENYFASSVSDGGTVLWLAEQMKAALLSVRLPDRSQGPPAA